MTSFAPIPQPGEVPPGMVHVGWYCTAPGHSCLMPLSRNSGRSAYPDEAHLEDANHHASWTPVYAPAGQVEQAGTPDGGLRPSDEQLVKGAAVTAKVYVLSVLDEAAPSRTPRSRRAG